MRITRVLLLAACIAALIHAAHGFAGAALTALRGVRGRAVSVRPQRAPAVRAYNDLFPELHETEERENALEKLVAEYGRVVSLFVSLARMCVHTCMFKCANVCTRVFIRAHVTRVCVNLVAFSSTQVALLSHLTIQGLAYLVVYNMLKTTDLQIVLQQLPAAVSSRVSTNAALLRGCKLPARRATWPVGRRIAPA